MSRFMRSSNFSKEPELFEFGFLGERGIGESLSRDTRKHARKSHAVIVASVVETKILFVQISEQMDGTTVHVRPSNCALDQTPIILHAVGVDIVSRVFNRVIDCVMDKFSIQPLVGLQFIGVECRAFFNVVFYLLVQCVLSDIRDNSGLDFAGFLFRSPLQDTRNNRLANRAASLNAFAELCPFVHVLGFPADIGFIGFYFPAEFFKRARLHSCADSVKHEPCSLLSDTNGAGNLTGANPVFGVCNHPNSRKPFIQANRTILEDRTDLDRKAFLAGFAVPSLAGGDV